VEWQIQKLHRVPFIKSKRKEPRKVIIIFLRRNQLESYHNIGIVLYVRPRNYLFVMNKIPGLSLRAHISVERNGLDQGELGMSCYEYVEDVKIHTSKSFGELSTFGTNGNGTNNSSSTFTLHGMNSQPASNNGGAVSIHL